MRRAEKLKKSKMKDLLKPQTLRRLWAERLQAPSVPLSRHSVVSPSSGLWLHFINLFTDSLVCFRRRQQFCHRVRSPQGLYTHTPHVLLHTHSALVLPHTSSATHTQAAACRPTSALHPSSSSRTGTPTRTSKTKMSFAHTVVFSVLVSRVF